MALETNTVHLPVAGGIQQDADDINQVDGLVTGNNIRFKKDGSAEKRYGNNRLSTQSQATGIAQFSGVQIGEGKLLSGRELVLLDGHTAHSYGDSASTAKWSTKSLCSTFTGTSRSVAGSNNGIIACSQATVSNTQGAPFVVVASRHGLKDPSLSGTANVTSSGDVVVRVIDATTGAEVNTTGALGLASNTDVLNSASRAYRVHVVAVGIYAVVVYDGFSSGNIYCRILDTDAMSWSSELTIVSDNLLPVASSHQFDVKPMNASGQTASMALVYQNSGYIVRVKRYTISASAATNTDTLAISDLSAGPYTAWGFGITPSTSSDPLTYHIVSYGSEEGGYVISRMRGVSFSGGALATVGSVVNVKTWTNMALSSGDYVACSGSCISPDSSTTYRLGYTLISGYDAGNPGPGVGDEYEGNVRYTTYFYSVSYDGATTFTPTEKAHFPRTRMVSSPFPGNYSNETSRESKFFCAVQKFTGYHVYNTSNANIANWSKSTIHGSCDADNFGSTYIVEIDLGSEDACFFPRSTRYMKLSPTTGSTFNTLAAGIQYDLRSVQTQFISPRHRRFVIETADANAGMRESVQLVDLTTDDKYRYQSYSSGEGVYVGGGMVSYFDGKALTPCGHTSPAGYITAEIPAAGTPMTASSFCYVYEFVDADGNVTRSEPCDAFDANGINYPFNIHIPYDWTSSWRQYSDTSTGAGSGAVAANIVIYGGASSSDMYEITRLKCPPFGPVALGGYGNPWDDYSTATYAVSGIPTTSAATGRPLVYTSGGVVSNVIPPASIGLCEYRGSLVILDHTKRRLWFSKYMMAGERAAFADEFVLDVPFDAECICNMDGALFVFGKNHIGVVAGEPWSDTNTGSTLSNVEIIATDVGCEDGRSLAVTPAGIMFRSSAGIYLLDRGKSVKFIGDQVRDTLRSYPNVFAAVVSPDDTTVQFFCCGDYVWPEAPSVSTTLVYNYKLDRWSVDTHPSGYVFIHAVMHNGVIYKLASDGSVWKEDSSTRTELYGGAQDWVTMTVEWPAIKPSGVNGLGRLRCVGVLGKYVSDCDVAISIAYDDDASYAYSSSFTNVTATITDLQFYPARQLGRSFRLKYSDATPTGGSVGSGGGIRLSGVSATIGSYSGMGRLDSAKRK